MPGGAPGGVLQNDPPGGKCIADAIGPAEALRSPGGQALVDQSVYLVVLGVADGPCRRGRRAQLQPEGSGQLDRRSVQAGGGAVVLGVQCPVGVPHGVEYHGKGLR